jgi:hypothetical protein
MTLNVLHLPRRKDRYINLIGQLSYVGITDYQIWEGFEFEPVVTAISQSFKRIVKDAQERGLEMVAIAEDDVWFTHPDSWKYFLENIPPYFDVYLSSYYSGTETFGGRVENYRGNSLIVVHSRFYEKFLNLDESINIDNAMDGLGEYFVCPLFAAIQFPGYSDQMKAHVDYSDRIPQHKLFKGYEVPA